MIENRSSAQTENVASFKARLSHLSWEDSEMIMFAYDIAKTAHSGQLRENGERYFEHPRRTALILMDECRIFNPNIISAALLHDALEDTFIFGSYWHLDYNEWMKVARFRAEGNFDADMIISLTKPKVGGDIKTEEEVMQRYTENLSKGPVEALLIKMADRLDNLRTLDLFPFEQQERKMKETEDTYYPLFERVLSAYPDEGRYLLKEIKKTIAKRRLEIAGIQGYQNGENQVSSSDHQNLQTLLH